MANERLILGWLMESIGCGLEPARVALEGGGSVTIDGVDGDESVLVQVFTERGPLKGPQRRRLSQDALKLITAGSSRPQARLIIAVTDAGVARAAREDGWLADALAIWEVEVLLVGAEPPPPPLPPEAVPVTVVDVAPEAEAEPAWEEPARFVEPAWEEPARFAEPAWEEPASFAEPAWEDPAPLAEPEAEPAREEPAPLVEPALEEPAPLVEPALEEPAPIAESAPEPPPAPAQPRPAHAQPIRRATTTSTNATRRRRRRWPFSKDPSDFR